MALDAAEVGRLVLTVGDAERVEALADPADVDPLHLGGVLADAAEIPGEDPVADIEDLKLLIGGGEPVFVPVALVLPDPRLDVAPAPLQDHVVEAHEVPDAGRKGGRPGEPGEGGGHDPFCPSRLLGDGFWRRRLGRWGKWGGGGGGGG